MKTDMKAVIEALGQLGETFNSALSQLSGDLLVEASRLKEVLSGVDGETRRLTELYDLEVGEDTLNQLLREYTETEKTCEKAFAKRRESLEKVLAKKRDAWMEKKEETIRQMKEKNASDGKTREREISEYTYDLGLKRGISDEEYARLKNEQEQTLKDLSASRQAAWDEKEKQISEREKQFEEYKEKVESFPKELEAAVNKAKEEGAGIARKQAKIKADLRAKDTIGEQAVCELKIQTLEDEISKQAASIDSLTQQLEVATRQAQELAVKAIEGASSQTSFKELKELALEQAKNPTKGK